MDLLMNLYFFNETNLNSLSLCPAPNTEFILLPSQKERKSHALPFWAEVIQSLLPHKYLTFLGWMVSLLLFHDNADSLTEHYYWFFLLLTIIVCCVLCILPKWVAAKTISALHVKVKLVLHKNTWHIMWHIKLKMSVLLLFYWFARRFDED